MKIILSRKGFDSSNGGCANPILPDGTLLSMPIPSDDKTKYRDLSYNGMGYDQILSDINPNPTRKYNHCHVDPDIRKGIRIKEVSGWKPGFGQGGAAQGTLAKAGVEKGDIFLFFGWFRQTEYRDGKLQFVKRNDGDFYHYADLQVIYGYMQIGDILTDKKEIAEYKWHPHASSQNKNNTIYIPSKKLSLNRKKEGYGVLDYREDRVLTQYGQNRGTWEEYPFLMPEHIYGDRKNSAKNSGLYYCGIWQEMVIYESEGLIEWVKKLLKE